MKTFLFLGLFLTTLISSELSLKTPDEAVKAYYKAMNSADISRLEQVMVKSSFDMTIKVWALSKALQDKAFAQTLKAYGTSPEIDKVVQNAVKIKLQNSPAKNISHLILTPLGNSRCMVRYKENAKEKQLYTSLHKKRWKIDYKAGRKID